MVATALQLPAEPLIQADSWYQGYANAARAEGIVQEGDLEGDWNQPISRKEMSAVALRAVDSSLHKPKTLMSTDYVLFNAVVKGILQA